MVEVARICCGRVYFLAICSMFVAQKEKKTFYFCFSLTLSRMQRQPGVAKCSVVRPDKGKTVRFF